MRSRRQSARVIRAIHTMEFLEQRMLLSADLPAADAPTAITDDDNAHVAYAGHWWSSGSGTGYNADDFRNDGNQLKGGSSAMFPLSIPVDGVYSVFARWPSITFGAAAANAPFDVTTSTGIVTIYENQSAAAGQWVLLGNFALSTSTAAVTVRNDNTDGLVLADAVGTAPTTDIITPPPPPPPPASIVIDDDDPNVAYAGNWWSSNAGNGYYAGDFRNDGNQLKGDSSVTFTPQLTAAGTYQVSMRWPSVDFGAQASNVPVDIITSTSTVTIIVDQTHNSGQWVSLGTFALDPATAAIRIRNDGTTGLVIADAVGLDPVLVDQKQIKPFSFPANITSAGRYTVTAHFPSLVFTPSGTLLSADIVTASGTVTKTITSGGDVSLGTFEFDPATAAIVIHDTGDNLPDSVTLIATAPLAPNNLTGNAVSSNEIDLTWTDNSPTAALVLQYGAGPTDQTTVSLPAGAHSFHATGLTPGASYTFTLGAVQNALPSSSISIGPIQTPLPPPSAPSTFAAAVASATEIDLSWTNTTADASLAILFSPNGGMFRPLANLPAGATSFVATGLDPGTSYVFAIYSTRDNQSSANVTTSPVQTPFVPPAAPTHFTASALSPTQVDLGWNSISPGASLVLQYFSNGATQTVNLPPGTHNYRVNGLLPFSAYTFSLYASQNNLASATVSAGPVQTPDFLPAAPSDLVASPFSLSRNDLIWASHSTNETGFAIERSLDNSTDWSLLATVPAGTTTYSDTGLHDDVRYYYRVRAFNSGGYSSYTSVASAHPYNPPYTNDNAGADATLTGNWQISNDGFGVIGTDFLTDSGQTKGSFSARIPLRVPVAGSYLVVMHWPSIHFATPDANVPVDIITASGLVTIMVDESTHADQWRIFGAYNFDPATAAVIIRNNGTTGVVLADGVGAHPLFVQPPPTNFAAVPVSVSEIDLSWASPDPTARFVLEYSWDQGYILPITLPAGTTSFAATGLSAGTNYTFRIQAVRSDGQTISDVVTIGPLQTLSS